MSSSLVSIDGVVALDDNTLVISKAGVISTVNTASWPSLSVTARDYTTFGSFAATLGSNKTGGM